MKPERVRSSLTARLPRRLATFTHRLGRRERVAFVLSGGGNLGAVQVGMLKALASSNIRPDFIIGCSVGSINGAAFAADPTYGGVERLERIWTRIAYNDPALMPSAKFVPLLAQVARKGESIHNTEPLANLLDEELPVQRFEQLQVPFHCVATDLERAEEFWISDGRLVPALLASAALPAVYPAVRYRGRTLVDGGVLRELHVLKALELGATTIYALHVGHLDGRNLSVQRPFDSVMNAYWTARRFRLEDDLSQTPDYCTVHRLPAGSKPRLRFDDFSQGPELAERAFYASMSYLQTGTVPRPQAGPDSEPVGWEEPVSDAIDNPPDRTEYDWPPASGSVS